MVGLDPERAEARLDVDRLRPPVPSDSAHARREGGAPVSVFLAMMLVGFLLHGAGMWGVVGIASVLGGSGAIILLWPLSWFLAALLCTSVFLPDLKGRTFRERFGYGASSLVPLLGFGFFLELFRGGFLVGGKDGIWLLAVLAMLALGVAGLGGVCAGLSGRQGQGGRAGD